MMNERISAIMSTNVIGVKPDDSLEVVKHLLFERHFHHLPVTDEDGKLVGIITSWDLIKSNKRFEDYGDFKVSDLMTKKVATLGPNDSVGAAAMVFLRHLFHGLPIVDDDKKLVGIITTHDIMKYEFQKEYPNDLFVKETHWVED
ncbi:MAG: CBS domain-containing protein [Saprospiraceae bacterium]|nr:CBS domain-containing protein [Saprospiraceae bacterium]